MRKKAAEKAPSVRCLPPCKDEDPGSIPCEKAKCSAMFLSGQHWRSGLHPGE